MNSRSGGATSPEPRPRQADEERLTGRDMQRREDAALLRGEAAFTDDLTRPGAVHLAFVRSDHGHARINAIDTSPAAELPGVLAVYTWEDLQASGTPGRLPLQTDGLDHDAPGHPVLARGHVRYHGQPVAAVVADDPYAARDGADAIAVEYEPLDAVVDPMRAAAEDAPTIHESVADNVLGQWALGDSDATGDAFTGADHVVALELRNNRLIPNALEPRVALASYDERDGQYTVELASQTVHGHRRKIAHTLGVSEGDIRVIAPAVGGGFGHKGHHHPGEAMAAWSARRLGRPVKWTATRRENYLEGAHGRDHRTSAELAVDADGAIRGLRVDTHANIGAYGLDKSPHLVGWYGALLSSQYAIPAIHAVARAVFTNTAPVHSYRGAGRPEAVYVTERLVDAAARELGVDPADLRRRNLIDPDAFPYETAVGTTYDSGDYEPALDLALEAIDYEDLRDRGRSREDGRLRGVGVTGYTESTGGGHEGAVVRVKPDGTVSVFVGTHSHGQGHETTYAQLVADELEIQYDRVEVAEGDTDRVARGTGTFGSRSTIVGGNAVVASASKVLEQSRRVAAERLEVEPEEVAYADGMFSLRDGGPSVSMTEVAEAAYGGDGPAGLEPRLEAATLYEAAGQAFTFGTHAAEVAVDPETGELEIVRYVAVDDCGERVNPRIVEGQVHGGVAQGIGQVRLERTVYDADGILRTDSMLEYALPRAADVPEMETRATVTPSPNNELGVKGIGEAGTIAAPPVIVNAVVDALADLGIRHVDMPVTDEAIWRVIEDATTE